MSNKIYVAVILDNLYSINQLFLEKLKIRWVFFFVITRIKAGPGLVKSLKGVKITTTNFGLFFREIENEFFFFFVKN